MMAQEEITIHTRGHRDLHDITEAVQDVVSRSGARSGIVNVFNVGSTGALGAIEFEPGLQATLLGPSLTVPIRDGRPLLGTWQQIFHLECDVRPRERTIVATSTARNEPEEASARSTSTVL